MYRYFLSVHFKRQVKGYIKKHISLSEDITGALRGFDKKTSIPLGANVYKIRMGSASIQKGKSKAFRMIVLLVEADSIIAPLAFYAKADQSTVSRQELLRHISMVRQELP